MNNNKKIKDKFIEYIYFDFALFYKHTDKHKL